MKQLYNLFLFLVICFLIYVIFRNFNYPLREGMETTTTSNSKSENGIAGNAASYAANIKSTAIKLQDSFLISKYRADYEAAILNMDELVDNLMLKTVLSVDPNNAEESIEKLTKMQQAKVALNSVMKFVDSQ
jgi:CHASE3 domain sensor protein